MTDREPPALHLDCHTCLAANTTACGDCIVSHLLANDDGPIEFVTTALSVVPGGASLQPAGEHAIGLLAKAGLLDAEPTWVDRSEFESASAAVPGMATAR